MTAEEVIEQTFDLHKYRMAQGVYHQTEEAVLYAMKEYALLKCQELLLLVADKAKIQVEEYNANTNTTSVETVTEHNYEDKRLHDIRITFDKDSILNAVDLDSFCS